MNSSAKLDTTSGTGQIVARLHGSRVVFPELSYAYPLKLLSPRSTQDGCAIVYMLSYGGGLVGGDHISLTMDIGPSGSTKVFKARPGSRKAVQAAVLDGETRQRMSVRVESGGVLCLLPDPVTCFAGAAYHQLQTFHLAPGASAIVLDWYTSGRRARGEEWAFERYRSVNEVFVGDTRVARDAVMLEAESSNRHDSLDKSTLAERMGPYACYAGVIVCGPAFAAVAQTLDERFAKETVFRLSEPLNVLWSVSPLKGADPCNGRMVRVAGKETEDVREWLKGAFGGVADVVGRDAYGKAFL